MWPPAKIITMRAAPMAIGANGPAPFSITVQPIVRTKKKVPMSSTRYLFIVFILQRVNEVAKRSHGASRSKAGGGTEGTWYIAKEWWSKHALRNLRFTLCEAGFAFQQNIGRC